MKYQHLITTLSNTLVNATTKRDIDKAITQFYKSLDGLSKEYKTNLIKKAVALARKMGMSKQDAIRVAHLRNIITSRYDKNHVLIRTAYDIAQAFNDVPRNITKDMKAVALAWFDDKEVASFGAMVKAANVVPKNARNLKTLEDNYITQVELDVEYRELPSDTNIVRIAHPDEPTRSEFCNEIHGTVWADKKDIEEWQKPLSHFNCRCRLIEEKYVTHVTRTAKGVMVERKCTKPDWLSSMQGISNIKKVKGKCEFTYVTLVDKRV